MPFIDCPGCGGEGGWDWPTTMNPHRCPDCGGQGQIWVDDEPQEEG